MRTGLSFQRTQHSSTAQELFNPSRRELRREVKLKGEPRIFSGHGSSPLANEPKMSAS